tara:strand:+ start:4176 stop:5255 length:1080 start_codon:yes stop_codon:yes gene_type:complete
MPVHTTRFTGDTYFTNTHTAGQKIYCRSTDAANDDGTINLYGRATSGATADYVQLNPGSNEGKIEQLSTAAWSHLYLAKWDTALTGVGSVFSNDGVSSSGTITVLSQPADGDSLTIGLSGFVKVFTWETGDTDANGKVKSVASASTCASNLAMAINDSTSGISGGYGTPAEGTGDNAWNNTDGPNPYLTATVSGATVTVTDKIACARQLAWVTTASDASKVSVSAIRGGIDGTKLVDIPATSTSASTSSISGVDLDSEDLATTNASGLLTGASDSMAVRGRFVVDIRCQDPGASVAAKIQTSNDNTNWRDAVSTITDLDTDQDQIISGTDCFGEWARLYISTWSVTAAKAYNIKFISQG